jgi:hypothetical protein
MAVRPTNCFEGIVEAVTFSSRFGLLLFFYFDLVDTFFLTKDGSILGIDLERPKSDLIVTWVVGFCFGATTLGYAFFQLIKELNGLIALTVSAWSSLT